MAEWVTEKLGEPFDAHASWSAFVPELTYGRHRMPPPPGARRAAVLVLLYRDGDELYVPLIERPTDGTIHSGQVSFPGGCVEPGESSEMAALRELDEELGVPAERVRLCGRLTSMYIYASRFLVTPCVAVAAERPVFRANPAEVACVLDMPLGVWRDAACRGEHQVQRRGLVFRAPHVEFLGRRIWGATSMMLAELLAKLDRPAAVEGR